MDIKYTIYLPGYFISNKMVKIYNELIILEANEEYDEYQKKLSELKELILLEDQEYNKLNINEINEYIDKFNKDLCNNIIFERYHTKLIHRKKVLLNDPKLDDSSLLCDIIESKFIIDMLKFTKKRILELITTNELEEETKKELLTYFYESRYDYLIDNNYIENLSILYNFNIDKIPSYTLEQIEEEFNIKFIKNSQNAFIDICLKDIDELNNLYNKNEDDLFKKTLSILLVTSEIESYINVIDKKNLLSISNYLHNINKNNTLDYIKELIKKRKRDFE